MPQRRSRRAQPSKRARTSGPGESSSSRPEPTPSPAAEETSSPQLSPASRIRRPLFIGTPIPGNVGLHARDFHGESYYDVPALIADPRFRDSMRLIEHYSLLHFMTPRQFYYPRVVLQFYNSMTSQERRVRWSSDSVSMIVREFSEQQTFQQHWACRQCRPILEVIEIGVSRLRERWSAF